LVLEDCGSTHEEVGAGGTVCEVVRGVALREFGFGWGRRVGVVLVLIADHQISCSTEDPASDDGAVGPMGLTPRGGRLVGRLTVPAQQA
jgi:hypothetical protein